MQRCRCDTGGSVCARRVILTQIGWRVHSLGEVAPPALLRPLHGLAGSVFAAARLVGAADHTLAAVDRDELGVRLADYETRASAAPHVAQAAAELARQVIALDRLPERRRAVEEDVSRLDNKLASLELRLRSAPRAGAAPALLEELDDLRNRLTVTAQLLEETNEAAPSAPATPEGRLHRTRRRGIFRAGRTYVVVEADEHGVKRPRIAASLAEAIQLRETLRAARHHGADPRNRHLARLQWEDKSSGSSGGGLRTNGEAGHTRTMAKRLLCRLGKHRWQRLKADGGGWFRKCRACGKLDDIPDRGPTSFVGM